MRITKISGKLLSFVRLFQSAQIPINIDFKKYCKLCISIAISWLFHNYGVTTCKKSNFGEDWFRIHGVIVHNPIFVKIQFSVISGNFHF